MQAVRQAGDVEKFDEASHGIAGWPFGDFHKAPPLPQNLPNGNRWPLILVVVTGSASERGDAATLASVERQDYPNLRSHRVESGCLRIADVLEYEGAEFFFVIRSGDLLAPGALAALALHAALMGADVVAGLRVLFDRGVLAVDASAQSPGRMRPARALLASDIDLAVGGDCLWKRAAVVEAGGKGIEATDPMTDLWNRLSEQGAEFARIGRPVLLQRYPRGSLPSAYGSRSIVALTDTGYTAGAGIAHRRLAEALGLAHHRLTHVELRSESPAAAAEWTNSFPKTEAAIAAGGHDLVLAGNLHGATRSNDILGRLGASLPVAAVLHDLFPLTGRCAFPQSCALIASGCDARCPTPDHYPQLPPTRIAEVYARKRAVLEAPGGPMLLANSAWTAMAARHLAGNDAGVFEMDLAFPTGVFRPESKAVLRQRLGLPEDDVIVMFGAVIVDAPGKGFADLSVALKAIARPGIRFVAAGRLDDPSIFGLPDLIATGPIGDEARLAEWYGACDIYITASQTETLGQTPVEAGLCGTPTVAYRSCGLTTAVIDGVSGLLTPVRASDLVSSIERLIADPELRRNLGAWGRIALENRNSYAAAALRMHDILEVWLGPLPGTAGARIRFSPDLMRYFAFSADRYEGNAATLQVSSHPALRRLRRVKHRLMGRGQPFWLRRLIYLASLLSRLRTGSS